MDITTDKKSQNIIYILIVLCCIYNAILAFINGNFFTLSSAAVAATEISLLFGICILIYNSGIKKSDGIFIGLLVIVFFSFILNFFATQIIFVDAIRNMLIIAVCAMIGARMQFETIEKVIFTCSIIVFIFLMIELVSLVDYAKILEPARYYSATRGIENPEFNETGLFANALSFESRYSFGIFGGPRTSSIFLEQVSLANYCNVLVIYLAVFWSYINTKRKCFYSTLSLLILFSNNSRTATALVLLSIVSYYFKFLIPRYSGFIVFVSTLVLALLIYIFVGNTFSDDLIGRVHHGLDCVGKLTSMDLFGAGIYHLEEFWDSGWAYLVASGTIFTSLYYVFFVIVALPQRNIMAIQFSFLLSVYVFSSLLVAGNSMFSIKTAAILWMLVGFLTSLDKNTDSEYD